MAGTTYRVLCGLNYGDKRAEIGAEVSDLPAKSIEWLLEQGHIEIVKSKAAAAGAAAAEADL